MALTATLQFGENGIESTSGSQYWATYLAKNVRCHFSCHHNGKHPDEAMRMESVQLTIVATNQDDMSLYQWYINRSLQNGRIVFQGEATINAPMGYQKELVFEGAQCVSLKETYDINDKSLRLIHLTIDAQHVIVNDIELTHF